MIKIVDVKEFRQLETGQCKAAIYFDESEADVFFSIKKKMKEGQAVQLVTLVSEEHPKENVILGNLHRLLLDTLYKAYELGKESKEEHEQVKVPYSASDPNILVSPGYLEKVGVRDVLSTLTFIDKVETQEKFSLESLDGKTIFKDEEGGENDRSKDE